MAAARSHRLCRATLIEVSPEEFRHAAYEHADWIANYLETASALPVVTSAQPGELISKLPIAAPEQGEPVAQIFADFKSIIVPALTLWNHPRFFGFFSTSAPPPSILAEFLSAALNANAMLWRAAPAATELEQVTLSWLRQWLGLAPEFFGVIYDTASIGVMQALAAAREQADPECRIKGMRPGLIVYVSEHTHNSTEKSAIILGFGRDNIRRIPVDDHFRMRPDILEQTIQQDIVQGKRPCFIAASIGSTSTAAIEPVPAIADIAERHNIWLHIDAAYGGCAAVVPEMRYIFEGVERAHSIILNPHKWLYVGFDCSVLYTRFPEIFRRSASLNAVYLNTVEDDRVVNFNDYGVQLGRRFRALKLWYVFRTYGREGIVALLRKSIQQALLLKQLVESDADFELAAPVHLSLVCFRHRAFDENSQDGLSVNRSRALRASNEANQQLLAEVNATGHAFLSQTILDGRYTLRFAIGNYMTTDDDIRSTWQLIQKLALRCKQHA